MAAYTCELDKGQQIYIENQGSQTVITLKSGGASQQQSQRNQFETGNWRVPPTVFQTLNGVVLRIEAEQSQRFIQVQVNGMSSLDAAPTLSDADVLPLRKVEMEEASTQSMPDMQPMQPMQPMKPMQPMQMDDMQMRMSNMEMRMGESPQTRTAKNFCSQCGSKIAEGNRFCSYCGNRLTP